MNVSPIAKWTAGLLALAVKSKQRIIDNYCINVNAFCNVHPMQFVTVAEFICKSMNSINSLIRGFLVFDFDK